MKTLDELKQNWGNNEVNPANYNETELRKIFRSRVKKQTKASFGYFWASFALQILVYAMLSHVLIRYWPDLQVRLLSVGGIVLFVPFTIMLMRKFKKMAVTTIPLHASGTTIQDYVTQHHTLLSSFYKFKKRYEWFLIPISTAIGVIITFKLYVPGSVYAHPLGALIAFGITLISCIAAIWNENKKSFEHPLKSLEQILAEFKES